MFNDEKFLFLLNEQFGKTRQLNLIVYLSQLILHVIRREFYDYYNHYYNYYWCVHFVKKNGRV